MSRSSIRVLTCDRCGHEEQFGQDREPSGWGTISAMATSEPSERPRGIGLGWSLAGHAGDDLCPGCTEALLGWYAEPKVPVDQPPAPPAPPPARKWTIEDDAWVVGQARDELEGAVDEAIAAYRQEATALLQDRPLPEAKANMDARATNLATLIRMRVQGRA